MRWYYACKVHECAVFFKGIYTSGNSRTTGLVRPNIQKKIRDICVHEMILHVKYTKIVYFSKESILQGTHARSDRFARTSKWKYMRIWVDACKYAYSGNEMILCMMESTRMCCIFQRNLYFRELTHDWTGSPEHPKENRRYLRTWDDIACKVHEDSVFFKGIYTCRELTHGRTGSPEHPKENNRYLRTWDDIMHVKYTNVLYFSKESILQGTHARLDWFARTSKRKYEISAYMRWYCM